CRRDRGAFILGRAMDDFGEDRVPHEDRSARWESPITWSALIVAGWALYELTTQPLLASFVICLKFGWEDFRTAFWLRRVDPCRPRAKACFALYIASGLWKTAIAASAMFCAIAVLSPPHQPAPPAQRQEADLPPTVLGSFVAAVVGYTFLALATCRALW